MAHLDAVRLGGRVAGDHREREGRRVDRGRRRRREDWVADPAGAAILAIRAEGAQRVLRAGATIVAVAVLQRTSRKRNGIRRNGGGKQNAWTVWSLERAQRTCGRLHVLVQTVVPGPGEGLAVKKTMDSFEVEAAWRRRPTCGSRGCGSGASASKIWPAACAVSVARRARSM